MWSGSSTPPWVKRLARYHRVRRWAAKIVAKVVRQRFPSARVYLVGSTVRGSSTIYSDIDVLICLDLPPHIDERKLVAEILSRAFDEGLPIDYPIELHIASENLCKAILEHEPHEEIEP